MRELTNTFFLSRSTFETTIPFLWKENRLPEDESYMKIAGVKLTSKEKGKGEVKLSLSLSALSALSLFLSFSLPDQKDFFSASMVFVSPSYVLQIEYNEQQYPGFFCFKRHSLWN